LDFKEQEAFSFLLFIRPTHILQAILGQDGHPLPTDAPNQLTEVSFLPRRRAVQ
jgi:hypothetical protein